MYSIFALEGSLYDMYDMYRYIKLLI